jgi:hypothetical protein
MRLTDTHEAIDNEGSRYLSANKAQLIERQLDLNEYEHHSCRQGIDKAVFRCISQQLI